MTQYVMSYCTVPHINGTHTVAVILHVSISLALSFIWLCGEAADEEEVCKEDEKRQAGRYQRLEPRNAWLVAIRPEGGVQRLGNEKSKLAQ